MEENCFCICPFYIVVKHIYWHFLLHAEHFSQGVAGSSIYGLDLAYPEKTFDIYKFSYNMYGCPKILQVLNDTIKDLNSEYAPNYGPEIPG